MCVCGRVKKTFSVFFYFRVLCQKTWSWSSSKVKKTLYDFLLSPSLSKNMVLVEIKSEKKHCFLLGSKVKKTLSTFGLSIEKTWTVLVPRSTVQNWSEVLGVEESVSTGAFVKHELKGVLKYTGKNLDPPSSPSPDR